MPPATAKRSIAAISGLRDARWAIPAKPRSPNQGDSPLTNAPRSMPAQKKPPGSGEHADRQAVVVVELLERAGHARRDGGVDGVSHLGAVERDQQHVPAPLGEDRGSVVIVHGAALWRKRRQLGASSARRRLARLGRLAARWLPSLERLAELADPFAEGAGQLRQALGAQHDQRDRADEQQVDGVLDAHAIRLARRAASGADHLRPAPYPCRAWPQEASALPGRPYPPPPPAEPFWPAQATILAAIGLQLLLPARLTVGPSWLIPRSRARC